MISLQRRNAGYAAGRAITSAPGAQARVGLQRIDQRGELVGADDALELEAGAVFGGPDQVGLDPADVGEANHQPLASAWIYPNQRDGWTPVPIGKLGAWYLLILLSFVLVTIVHPPQAPGEGEHTNPLT